MLLHPVISCQSRLNTDDPSLDRKHSYTAAVPQLIHSLLRGILQQRHHLWQIVDVTGIFFSSTTICYDYPVNPNCDEEICLFIVHHVAVLVSTVSINQCRVNA